MSWCSTMHEMDGEHGEVGRPARTILSALPPGARTGKSQPAVRIHCTPRPLIRPTPPGAGADRGAGDPDRRAGRDAGGRPVGPRRCVAGVARGRVRHRRCRQGCDLGRARGVARHPWPRDSYSLSIKIPNRAWNLHVNWKLATKDPLG